MEVVVADVRHIPGRGLIAQVRGYAETGRVPTIAQLGDGRRWSVTGVERGGGADSVGLVLRGASPEHRPKVGDKLQLLTDNPIAQLEKRVRRLETVQVIRYVASGDCPTLQCDAVTATMKGGMHMWLQPFIDDEGICFVRVENEPAKPANPTPKAPEGTEPVTAFVDSKAAEQIRKGGCPGVSMGTTSSLPDYREPTDEDRAFIRQREEAYKRQREEANKHQTEPEPEPEPGTVEFGMTEAVVALRSVVRNDGIPLDDLRAAIGVLEGERAVAFLEKHREHNLAPSDDVVEKRKGLMCFDCKDLYRISAAVWKTCPELVEWAEELRDKQLEKRQRQGEIAEMLEARERARMPEVRFTARYGRGDEEDPRKAE